MYNTTCPYCGEKNRLEVVSGTFSAIGMRLSEDGFSFIDARQIDTEDEKVRCQACNRTFPLAELDAES
jgi:uncharacterized protein YbaR (Trm112 family)